MGKRAMVLNAPLYSTQVNLWQSLVCLYHCSIYPKTSHIYPYISSHLSSYLEKVVNRLSQHFFCHIWSFTSTLNLPWFLHQGNRSQLKVAWRWPPCIQGILTCCCQYIMSLYITLAALGKHVEDQSKMEHSYTISVIRIIRSSSKIRTCIIYITQWKFPRL